MKLGVADQPDGLAQEILFGAVKIEVDEAFDPEFLLDLVFGKCGEANAYYKPNDKQITICAELASLFLE